MNNTENSFIKNVNNIAANLELIKQVPQLFDEETILRLEKLSDIDITQITEDLKSKSQRKKALPHFVIHKSPRSFH